MLGVAVGVTMPAAGGRGGTYFAALLRTYVSPARRQCRTGTIIVITATAARVIDLITVAVNAISDDDN